jgi:hypothetical protein
MTACARTRVGRREQLRFRIPHHTVGRGAMVVRRLLLSFVRGRYILLHYIVGALLVGCPRSWPSYLYRPTSKQRQVLEKINCKSLELP